MKTYRLVIVAVLLLLFPMAANAEWERTVSAWDTRLPDEGKVQLTVWGSYWETELTPAIDLQELGTDLDITYGISDKWSIALSPSFYIWDVNPGVAESGISDTGIMTTYRFVNEDEDGFDMAVQGHLWIPTGDEDKGLSSDCYEPGVKLLASKKLGPIIGVANIGINGIIDARPGEKDMTASLTLEGVYPLNEQLSLNMSLYGGTKRYDAGDDSADIGAGFRFTPKMGKMFLAGVVYYSLKDTYDWGLTLAAGFEF